MKPDNLFGMEVVLSRVDFLSAREMSDLLHVKLQLIALCYSSRRSRFSQGTTRHSSPSHSGQERARGQFVDAFCNAKFDGITCGWPAAQQRPVDQR